MAKQSEQVQEIPISELFPFKDHPFRVLDDEAMQRTVESISQFGVLAPAIARPRTEGGYEIIAGHRRLHASQLLGLETMPVLVRQMDDDSAIITMVDNSNLQRETMLPSERARAYKMKMDAMARRAGRPSKENSGQLDRNFLGKFVADPYRRDVRDQHTDGSADHNENRSCVFDGKRDGCNLSFITHFCQEEGDKGYAENTEPHRVVFQCIVITFVRDKDPCRHGKERTHDDPFNHFGAEDVRDPRAECAGKGVIKDRRDQNTENNRRGLFEARSKKEGEELRFVAHFSKGYRSDGNEDGFHEFSPIRQKRNESSARRKRSKIHRSRQALTCAGTAMA